MEHQHGLRVLDRLPMKKSHLLGATSDFDRLELTSYIALESTPGTKAKFVVNNIHFLYFGGKSNREII